jgi:ribosomal protein S18 acetylase RimI-like enzyme
MNGEIEIRPFGPDDREWAYELLFPAGTESRVASKGTLYDPLALPGFVAWHEDERIGLVTYRPEEWEILTLDSVTDNTGAGTALIDAVKEFAKASGAKEVWLITTNDNTHAFRFYQRRGFVVREVRPGAVDRERHTIKPEIPVLGRDDIPIRDEIELVIDL